MMLGRQCRSESPGCAIPNDPQGIGGLVNQRPQVNLPLIAEQACRTIANRKPGPQRSNYGEERSYYLHQFLLGKAC